MKQEMKRYTLVKLETWLTNRYIEQGEIDKLLELRTRNILKRIEYGLLPKYSINKDYELSQTEADIRRMDELDTPRPLCREYRYGTCIYL